MKHLELESEDLEVQMKLSNQDFEYLETVYNIVYSKKKDKFFQNCQEIDKNEVMTILEADEYEEYNTFEKFTNRRKSYEFI